MRQKRLAIVLSRPIDAGLFALATQLANAANNAGHDVGMFFMSDAVRELSRHQQALANLAEAGCELVACASSAHHAGLSEAMLGMPLGSQDDHAALVHRADRVVAIT